MYCPGSRPVVTATFPQIVVEIFLEQSFLIIGCRCAVKWPQIGNILEIQRNHPITTDLSDEITPEVVSIESSVERLPPKLSLRCLGILTTILVPTAIRLTWLEAFYPGLGSKFPWNPVISWYLSEPFWWSFIDQKNTVSLMHHLKTISKTLSVRFFASNSWIMFHWVRGHVNLFLRLVSWSTDPRPKQRFILRAIKLPLLS